MFGGALWGVGFVVGLAWADPPRGANVQDPRALHDLAVTALHEGRDDEARVMFGRMLDQQEVSAYLEIKGPLRKAVIAERMGEVADATTAYREAIRSDALRAVQVLRIVSEHPDRDKLVTEAYDHVRALVERAKAGEEAVIYVTSKGEKRALEVMTTEDVLKLAAEGKAAQYCYVESLDLTQAEALPDAIQLTRCVVGRIYGPGRAIKKLVFKGIVLGDVDLGKVWVGEVNKSKTIPASTFDDLVFREAVILGKANFDDVKVNGGRAYFPMAVFEGKAQFKGVEFFGVTEFRFASFGAGANFAHARLHDPVYFGGSRYHADTVFTHLYSERTLYFNDAVFEAKARFDECEWMRDATFENARFLGPTDFATTEVSGLFNLSRAVFEAPVTVKELHAHELHALGVWFQKDAWFTDSVVEGRAQFALDDVARRTYGDNMPELLGLYRVYQGDEDADEPLVTTTSYGVTAPDDLTARFDGNISFANTEFRGYTVFEGVTFGQQGQALDASFVNAQFLGETHFERSTWWSLADFTTIFGPEVSFNEARFERALILDDVNIQGRLSLTDATFADDADLSFYSAEVRSFAIDPTQVDGTNGEPHRLFYERCATGRPFDRQDVRIARMERDGPLSDEDLAVACFANLNDELINLKGTYEDAAMIEEADDTYWWMRHYEALERLWYGGWGTKAWALVLEFLVFEWVFGWGVKLGNIAIAMAIIGAIFGGLYRHLCPDAMIEVNGEPVRMADLPWPMVLIMSYQTMFVMNMGWDMTEEPGPTFKVLVVLEVATGVLLVTFLVAAYTRMILA